ncbi:MAG: V-type ATP synthase subunit F [Methanosarcinaceae archaeon]|nr:V-type ATP synthase subunit F [Methanosarcinaceae archaeon]
MEIAVVGNSEFVTGFRLAGMKKVFAVDDSNKLNSTVTNVFEDSDVGILVMHNDDFNKLPETMRGTLSESVEPTLVTLGGAAESSNLRDKIKQSVGVDLWK